MNTQFSAKALVIYLCFCFICFTYRFEVGGIQSDKGDVMHFRALIRIL